MMFLVIAWGSVGIKTVQFILSLSFLVVLHELGHFIPARLFKCRVEKFYLFFNPWFSLWKIKIGETEYGIGWIPFGGFVKIAGMIDESMDSKQLKQAPQPHEFRSKPAWQRFIVMIGGVTVNMIVALFIFIFISWIWGERYTAVQDMKYGIYADSLAQTGGFKNGDRIIAVDNQPILRFNKVPFSIIYTGVKTVTVLRDSNTIQLQITKPFTDALQDAKDLFFIAPRTRVVVDSVLPTAKILQGQLVRGDTLLAMNTIPFTYYDEFIAIRNKTIDSIVTLTIQRGTEVVTAQCMLKNGLIGFATVNDIVGASQANYTFLQSVPRGISRSFTTLKDYIAGLKQLKDFKRAKENLGGLISIGNLFPSMWDWQAFWTLTGVLSLILAFMNILPIPALDGGHALFALYEIVTRRKPSDKFLEYAQTVGMVLLLGLIVYSLGLDVWRLFK